MKGDKLSPETIAFGIRMHEERGWVLCGRVEFRSVEWLVDKRGNQVAPCGWIVGICRALVAAGLGRHALIVRTWDRRPVCTIDSIADVAA